MFGAWRPRQMLPPPTTTAIWTPIEVTSTNWSARWPVDAEEMPYGGSAGVNASPESFRSTRRYASVPSAPGAASGASVMDAPRRASGCVWNGSSLRLLAQLEPGEPADRQFLADSSGRLVDQLRDRALVVLHERLVEQHVVLEERVQLPLDDAVEDVLGRPLFAGLPLGHPALGGDHVLRDVLATEPPGLRAGDVQRDVLGQLLELVGVRHEVGLAVDLHQHAHPGVEVDVGLDPALLGHPPCAARLQSIIPAPVASRRAFTCAALMLLSLVSCAMSVHARFSGLRLVWSRPSPQARRSAVRARAWAHRCRRSAPARTAPRPPRRPGRMHPPGASRPPPGAARCRQPLREQPRPPEPPPGRSHRPPGGREFRPPGRSRPARARTPGPRSSSRPPRAGRARISAWRSPRCRRRRARLRASRTPPSPGPGPPRGRRRSPAPPATPPGSRRRCRG